MEKIAIGLLAYKMRRICFFFRLFVCVCVYVVDIIGCTPAKRNNKTFKRLKEKQREREKPRYENILQNIVDDVPYTCYCFFLL